jgi:phenylalanyl-tRNA synthetase beta chain
MGMTKEKETLSNKQLLKVKKEISTALQSAGYECTFVQKSENLPVYAHPAQSAQIVVGETVIGVLCSLHPAIVAASDTSYGIACASVHLNLLKTLEPRVYIPRPLPLFPVIELDETIALPESFESMKATMLEVDPLLESIHIIDLYEKEDRKTITLRFTYAKKDRTLTQEEVDRVHKQVMASV